MGPTHEAGEQRVGVVIAYQVAGLGTRLQGPVIDVVLRDQRSAGRLVMPGNAPTLQDFACRRAEMHHIALRHTRLALKLDAETAPNAARTTVASNEIGTAYRLAAPSRCLAHNCRDAVVILLAVLESRTEPGEDERFGLDGALESWLDQDLRHAHGGFKRLATIVAARDLGPFFDYAGIAEPMQLVARHGCDPGNVKAMRLRHSHRAQWLREAKLAEELHRADIGDVHLRMLRCFEISFDHHRLHAKAGQRQR